MSATFSANLFGWQNSSKHVSIILHYDTHIYHLVVGQIIVSGSYDIEFLWQKEDR